VGEKTAGHETVTLPTLGKRVVAETFQGVAKFGSLKLLARGERKGAVRILWGRVDLIDQLRFVLIGCHISLILEILFLCSIEISRK
jgi:hypothetical protein